MSSCALVKIRRVCTADQGSVFLCEDQSSVSNGFTDVVDIFDAHAGTWHTAQLSVARGYVVHDDFSATSLPSQGLALFAGGRSALLMKSMC